MRSCFVLFSPPFSVSWRGLFVRLTTCNTILMCVISYLYPLHTDVCVSIHFCRLPACTPRRKTVCAHNLRHFPPVLVSWSAGVSGGAAWLNSIPQSSVGLPHKSRCPGPSYCPTDGWPSHGEPAVLRCAAAIRSRSNERASELVCLLALYSRYTRKTHNIDSTASTAWLRPWNGWPR